MNWTIACNGTEKLAADWGLTQLTRKLVSQGTDELSFKAERNGCGRGAAFFSCGATVVLWRDRAADGGGIFSGGTTWFQGLVTQIPRAGAPNAESMTYRVAGPWWYLDNLVFQQVYQNIPARIRRPRRSDHGDFWDGEFQPFFF